jgi:hypothetical protein
VFFILRERVVFSPSFLFEIGYDVLAGDRARFMAEYPYCFVYTRLMVADTAVAHAVAFAACELIEPAVQLDIGLAEKPD